MDNTSKSIQEWARVAVRAMLWCVTRQAAEELERQALELRRLAR